ncbi:MAG: DUF1295 domain-containing protein, partial [Chloroflexi bacterium]|nr:DUF1295 domain-containing protein [Chloroflexota bacterium]
AIFAAAYAVESRYLRNEARAVSTSLVGWIALLLCYPPLNDAIGELQPWTQVDVSPFLWEPLILLHYTVIVLFALGFLGATLALNLKAAQLSHRGIVTSGPYRLVRHPAYACRIAIWWLVTLAILSVLLVPANVETAGPAALNLTLTAAAWTIVYVIRARAEERLLCEDPTYLAYCQRVRWRFLPGAF